MELNDPIERLNLVGPTYAKRLQKLGINTIEDLIFHFPFRYDDFSLISPISKIQAGETVTIKGKVLGIKNEYTKSGKKIQKAKVDDNSGEIEIVWFNQPYLTRTIKTGDVYNFSGKVDWIGRSLVLVSPEFEIEKPFQIHTGRLVPVYPETYGISSKWLRARIKSVLDLLGNNINEFLPEDIIKKESLLDEREAILQTHFPSNKETMEQSRNRLAFDELFLIQLSSKLRKKEWQGNLQGKSLQVDNEKVTSFINKLPFVLTNSQKKVLNEILSDLQKPKPMNRLLQGDVGSGKTVVAAISAYVAFLNSLGTLFMAPTEILANQHYKTFKTMLEPHGIPVELITSSHKTIYQDSNIARVFVGTHSLLYQDFDLNKIGLIVIDEQHRFGVEQRLLLAKKGRVPHVLTMTATPIPRTIALAMYGDLDLSVIDELPVGRLKIKTWVVPKEKRQKAYIWIKEKVKNTIEQAFIICPLIDESESESLKTVRAVTKEFEALSKSIFPDLRLGLIHGRVKSKEKEILLNKFKEGNLDILVSTPVVEVGIDIPNATIMLIEGSDRFGLAQLHQLRGRVGRNNIQSYCLLFSENENPKVINKLKSLEKTNIGMELAEIDLKLRGPGEIYGTKQHGIPDLKIASFSDFELIKKAKLAAQSFLASIFNLPPSADSPLNSRLKKYKMSSASN